jgi:hypothetical protein
MRFGSGQYELAEARLRSGLEKQGDDGRDLLLYLMDLGLTLHAQGKFVESNQFFEKADRIAEIKDYTSLSKEFSSFVINDNIKDYKGEDFEKVLINVYKALNYAALGSHEEALVEARVVNRKLHLMINEGQRKYQQNAFARYLAGILFESEQNWNDAYVSYKFTHELAPGYPGLGADLWRLAKWIGIREDMDRWDKEYSLTKEDHERAKDYSVKAKKAEIIVIFENGQAPIKKPNPQWNSLPHFVARTNPVSQAQVLIGGESRGDTQVLHNIESTAIENLKENYALMVAKGVGRTVGKVIVGDQVGRQTNSPLLGLLTQVALLAVDQPDLRSWVLLPKDLQLARILVEPGTYPVRLKLKGSGTELPERIVQAKAGEKVFVNFRYTP